MRKKPKKEDQPEMPLAGEGVEPLSIPEIDKAIAKYEKKKDARCAESPGEMAAKKELKELLHLYRESLPKNGGGEPFYRSDDKDYTLTEKLKAKKWADDGDDDEA